MQVKSIILAASFVVIGLLQSNLVEAGGKKSKSTKSSKYVVPANSKPPTIPAVRDPSTRAEFSDLIGATHAVQLAVSSGTTPVTASCDPPAPHSQGVAPSSFSYLTALKRQIESRSQNDCQSVTQYKGGPKKKNKPKNNLEFFQNCLKQAPVTVNFSANIFKSDLGLGILTAADRNKATGTRKRVERTLFGTQEKIGSENPGSGGGPVYAALDFSGNGGVSTTRSESGEDPLYGRSFFKLKEEVKNAATMLHTDSFDYVMSLSLSTNRLADFNNICAVIRYMSQDELTNFIEACQKNTHLKKYIEVQIHKPVTWESVEEVILDYDDISPNEPLDTIHTIIRNAEKLKSEHQVKIRYVGSWPTPLPSP